MTGEPSDIRPDGYPFGILFDHARGCWAVRRRRRYLKHCAHCGRSFVGWRTQRACSSRCRKGWWRRYQRFKGPITAMQAQLDARDARVRALLAALVQRYSEGI